MNSSIQDAFNLGWKLALVTKSLAPPKILESYTAERVPIMAGVLEKTTKVLNKTVAAKATKNIVNSLARGLSFYQLDVHYRGSPIVFDELKSEDDERVTAGDRAPDAPALVPLTAGVKAGASQLFDLFSPIRHTAIIFPADKEEIATYTTALQKYPDGTVYTVVVLPKGSELAKEESRFNWGVDVVLDGDQHCWNTYPTKEGAKVVIVRPDGCVGAVAESTAGVEQYRGIVFDVSTRVGKDSNM
jgi:hypothetical protein